MDTTRPFDTNHHIAIAAQDASVTIAWYTQTFPGRVRYQDATWALLEFVNLKVTMVTPQQHPPHLAVVHPQAAQFGPLHGHYDGTSSIHTTELARNTGEMMGDDEATS